MRIWGTRNPSKAPRSRSDRADVQKILTQYVLHMSITSLANEDITPLYEEYAEDRRLGDSEREELAVAYRALHLSPRAAGDA